MTTNVSLGRWIVCSYQTVGLRIPFQFEISLLSELIWIQTIWGYIWLDSWHFNTFSVVFVWNFVNKSISFELKSQFDEISFFLSFFENATFSSNAIEFHQKNQIFSSNYTAIVPCPFLSSLSCPTAYQIISTDQTVYLINI